MWMDVMLYVYVANVNTELYLKSNHTLNIVYNFGHLYKKDIDELDQVRNRVTMVRYWVDCRTKKGYQT